MNGHPQVDIVRELERRYSQSITETNVEEVWFAGCHCGMYSADADHHTLTLVRSCSDVGGGSVENGARYSLARISLRWMIRECFKANAGILFHGSMFNEIGLDPATLYPHVVDRPVAVYGDAPDMEFQQLKPETTVIQCDPRGTYESEELEDLSDALSPLYDQLRIGLHWWMLELIPQKQQYQKEDGTWVKNIGYVARFIFWTFWYRRSLLNARQC